MARKTSEKLLHAQDESELLQITTETDIPSAEESCVPVEENRVEEEPASPEVSDGVNGTESDDLFHLLTEEMPQDRPEDQPSKISEEPPETIFTDVDAMADPLKIKENTLAEGEAVQSDKVLKPKADKVKPATKVEQKPQNARQSFYSLDFRTLDRGLSPEQEEEWNAIYASFRSRSMLTGTVVGVDEHTFDVTDEGGKTNRRTIQSLVVIGYRVKIMIPETEIWEAGEEHSHYAIRGMVGARIDYVIINVDRENDCAIASRRMAMTKRRRHFRETALPGHDLVSCDVLVVSRKLILANCGGYDLTMTQRDLSYTAIADLRSDYKPGMQLKAKLLEIKDGKPVISVKEVNPNPFDGAELRHPVGCRRQAVIAGKYAGGVFCRLSDDTTCLCLYSNSHFDTEFQPGDTVLIHITEFNDRRKLIYGRIVSKR